MAPTSSPLEESFCRSLPLQHKSQSWLVNFRYMSPRFFSNCCFCAGSQTTDTELLSSQSQDGPQSSPPLSGKPCSF